jgi:toxin YhaV
LNLFKSGVIQVIRSFVPPLIIKEKIVLDSLAAQFTFTGPLRRYGRMKGMGLPNRCRLFFRAFTSEDRQVLIVLWLGYPRKAGDKRDCYEVFTKMVGNGDFPDSLQELLDLLRK